MKVRKDDIYECKLIIERMTEKLKMYQEKEEEFQSIRTEREQLILQLQTKEMEFNEKMEKLKLKENDYFETVDRLQKTMAEINATSRNKTKMQNEYYLPIK